MWCLCDRASRLKEDKKYFKNHPDIILMWYLMGYPYMNPVEELIHACIWSHSCFNIEYALHLTRVVLNDYIIIKFDCTKNYMNF